MGDHAEDAIAEEMAFDPDYFHCAFSNGECPFPSRCATGCEREADDLYVDSWECWEEDL